MIVRVLGQRAMSPGLSALETVVVRIEAHQVNGKLAPSDDLVQEGLLVCLGGIGPFYRESDGDWTDVAEVQIGRQATGVVDFRLVALGAVSAQFVVDEISQQAQGLASSPAPPRDRRDRAVERPTLGDIHIWLQGCDAGRLPPRYVGGQVCGGHKISLELRLQSW